MPEQKLIAEKKLSRLYALIFSTTLYSNVALVQAQQGDGSNELLLSLYDEMTVLQQELQTLRGIVEEQKNKIRQLEQDTRDRYIDMDNRLSALSKASANVLSGDLDQFSLKPQDKVDTLTNIVASDTQKIAGNIQESDNAGDVGSDYAGLGEQELYRLALNALLEENKSEEAVVMFRAYEQRYPSGRLMPNSLYWLGEALLLLANYDEAISAFQRVLENYPTDAKAPGALLKMGVAMNQKGDRASAEALWGDLSHRYPDSTSEIRLAQDYLARP